MIMSEVYILQNQAKLFLGKQKDWLDGRDPGSLFKTPHKDEAINQMFEISSKDYTQRIRVISCAVTDKGLPIIDSELLPEAGTSAPAAHAPVVSADADADADADAGDDVLGEASEEEALPENLPAEHRCGAASENR